MLKEPCESPEFALIQGRVKDLNGHLLGLFDRGWNNILSALRGNTVVTGVGGSTGPARIFASLLVERLGRAARFVPLSVFFSDKPPASQTLVLFSQGLSPNAQLALAHHSSFESVVVFTSASMQTGGGQILKDVESRGGTIVTLPPTDEPGTLLRVVGPAVATLSACLVVETACSNGDPHRVLEGMAFALRSAEERALKAAEHVASQVLDGQVAMVSVGVDPALLHGYQWKWLEGLRVAEPFGWDLLEVAHGPIQSIQPPFPTVPVIVFAHLGQEALLERLRRVIAPAGHPIIVLQSALPAPFSFIDHDAQLNAILMRVLWDRPRDLRVQASSANDGPLYELAGLPGAPLSL